MKRNLYLSVLAGILLLLSQSFSTKDFRAPAIPDEVNKILIASCYDCHSDDAKSKDAREALNFESWDDYKLTKKIGLLGDICKLVEEDKMPPGKYLKSKPDRKLSGKQKELLCDWTEEESTRLMEGE